MVQDRFRGRKRGDVAKWLRRRFAKPLFTGSNPVVASNYFAGVAELADAADLKSAGAILVGSSPTPGTSQTIVNPWAPPSSYRSACQDARLQKESGSAQFHSKIL